LHCALDFDVIDHHRNACFAACHESPLLSVATFVCNQFIHSYIFVPAQNKNGSLSGVYVSSDKAKNDKLYFVGVDQILDAFRLVGKD